MEADLVKRFDIPFACISAGRVHVQGRDLFKLPRNVWQLVQGYLDSRRILKEFRPDVVLFTGGFVAVPMGLAARSVPTALFVPDIEPGWALKALAWFANRIALVDEASRPYFKRQAARLTVTGYPTRAEMRKWDRAAARETLGLSGVKPVLLVIGGSTGARTLTQPVLAALPELLRTAQVLLISGKRDWEAAQAAQAGLPADLAGDYHPVEYLHEMGAALAAADLAISRAGASTLGEFPLFGLPAILSPYPYAWRYQKVNADALVSAGAARLIPTGELAQRLLPEVRSLFENPAVLEKMRQQMRSLARPQAADEIADMIRALAARGGEGKPWSA
jgi:UDP-N-acetylglucosamine--N-acetylmuramyl-(pentapeptide) pyrophosphoryl-undecaprenol N-acetylglucosamine transferase